MSHSGINILAQISHKQFYKAETANNKGLLLLKDSTASSGKFLRMKDTGSITWNVLTDTSTWYELVFRYRAFGGEKEEYIVRNGYQYAVGFGICDTWNLYRTRTYLQKGANKIELKESWGNIDIDYLEVEPVNIKPTVKPLHNIFYREAPRDLFFKINRFGRQIESVRYGVNNLRFDLSDFPEYEDAVILRIPEEEIAKLGNGNNLLRIYFDNNIYEEVSVRLVDMGKPAGLTIIAPYVDHGASVLIILPTNKILLVDCGQDWVRDSILIPLLHRMGIDKIDYFIITHYHEDHDSGDKGEKVKNLFHVETFWDYHSFRTCDEFELEGTHVKILNSYEDGEDENTRSLSFKMEYKGFVYVHGSDMYAVNQKMIIDRFPDDIEAEVFCANHHFHGSVDVDYLRAVNPAIVIIQAQQAVYARSAYMKRFKNEIEGYLIGNKKRYIEDLPTWEVGTVIVRVNSKADWSYETSKTAGDKIPFLLK
jgi:hypothetical protein